MKGNDIAACLVIALGVGGVLEPVQAAPVIIEDDCFHRLPGHRGRRGAHLPRIGAGRRRGDYRIDAYYRRNGGGTQTVQGLRPAGSVVIPGSYPKRFPAGEYGVPCALIIGRRKESTDKKTSLTAALRDFGVSV